MTDQRMIERARDIVGSTARRLENLAERWELREVKRTGIEQAEAVFRHCADELRAVLDDGPVTRQPDEEQSP